MRLRPIAFIVRILLSVVIFVAALAALASAQTVPGPRVNLTFDQPMAASCENPAIINAWNFTYGSCYLPTGVNLGDPWISHVRVTFTGTATVSNLVPRAQVVQETVAANCQSTPPCLRINGLAAPAGNSNITVHFVSTEGREGGPSNSVPFSGSPATVPAAGGLRRVTP